MILITYRVESIHYQEYQNYLYTTLERSSAFFIDKVFTNKEIIDKIFYWLSSGEECEYAFRIVGNMQDLEQLAEANIYTHTGIFSIDFGEYKVMEEEVKFAVQKQLDLLHEQKAEEARIKAEKVAAQAKLSEKQRDLKVIEQLKKKHSID